MILVVEQLLDMYERYYGAGLKKVMGNEWKVELRKALTISWEDGETQGMQKMYNRVYK